MYTNKTMWEVHEFTYDNDNGNSYWYFQTWHSARAFLEEWKTSYVENCSYNSREDGDDPCTRCEARFAALADNGLVDGNGIYLKITERDGKIQPETGTSLTTGTGTTSGTCCDT